MTIDKRIKFGMAIVMLAALIITIIGIWGMVITNQHHRDFADLHKKEEFFNAITLSLSRGMIYAMSYSLAPNEINRRAFLKNEEVEEELFKDVGKYDFSSKQTKLLEGLHEVHEEFEGGAAKVIASGATPNPSRIINTELAVKTDELETALNESVHEEMHNIEDANKTRSRIYYVLIVSVLIVSLFLGVSAAFYLASKVIDPLKELTKHLEAAAVRIFSSSEQQASGASEQAASVAETTATVEELDQTSVQIAQNAQAVAGIAEKTLQSAKKGENSVNLTMDALSNIEGKTIDTTEKISSLEEKSKAINQILEIINDIAEQTNLLALNAAIEASRAGEAGKGFQVVASEIKKLAESVVNSTGDIKDIISELNGLIGKAVVSTGEVKTEVGKGVSLSKAGKEGLQKIVELVEEATNSAKQISIATRQQQSASKQVVVAMKEVADVAKQSADASKENTGSIQKLTELARKLKAFIGQEKLDNKVKPAAS